jgi:RimJ/RimL family protein N-acetyltransferase
LNIRKTNSPKDADEIVGAVSRDGRSVKLVPVESEAAVEFLYQLAIDESVGWRWRFGGMVPRRDTFEQTLWNGVLTQFVIVEKAHGAMVGSTLAYNADLNHGTAYVAAAMLREATRSGVGIEAADLFAAHLFACYRIRKLYFEVPEYNIPQFESSIGWLLREEGSLLQHTYYQGRFWDRKILALYREDYESVAAGGRVLGRRRRVPGHKSTRSV